MDYPYQEFVNLLFLQCRNFAKIDYFIAPSKDELENICLTNYQNVSRETFLKLEKYHEQILKWNSSINLISRAEEHDIWARHIIDSLAVMYLLKQSDIIIDVGSGGGFPGIVIGALGNNVTMIEINAKKCAFLNQMKTVLKLPMSSIINDDLNQISQERIIEMAVKNLNSNGAISNSELFISKSEFVVTARAFAKIKDILDMTEKMRLSIESEDIFHGSVSIQNSQNVSRETFSVKYLLHKSKNQFAHEIEEARKSYDFNLRTHDNPFNNLSVFVELENVRKKS